MICLRLYATGLEMSQSGEHRKLNGPLTDFDI